MKTDQLRGQTVAVTLSGRFWNQGEPEVWTIRRLSLSVKWCLTKMPRWKSGASNIHGLSNNSRREKTAAFVQSKSEVLPRPDVQVDVLTTAVFYCKFI